MTHTNASFRINGTQHASGTASANVSFEWPDGRTVQILASDQVSSTNYYLTSFSSTNYYLTYLRLTRALCLYGPHPPHPMTVCPALSGGGVGPGTWTGERTKGQTARMKHKNVPSAASSSPACASGFRVDTHSTISASKSNANPARKCSS